MGDMEVDPPPLSAEAARKKVSPASHSGGNFFRWVPTAEFFNKLTLLKYFLLILLSCFVF